MFSFWNILKNTFSDYIRQPVFLVLLLSSNAAIILLGNVYYFALGDDIKLVKDSALSIMLLTGLFGAVFGASSAVASEIRGGTALILLSKPINRAQFLTAKFGGIAVSLTLMLFLNIQASLLASRMAFDAYGEPDLIALGLYAGSVFIALAFAGAGNFLFRRSFVRDAVMSLLFFLTLGFFFINWIDSEGVMQTFGAGLDWNLAPAGVLILFALWLLCGLAVAFTTRLQMLPAFMVCCFIFLLGLMSDYLFGRAAADGSLISSIIYAVIPNWQLFWMADAIDQSRVIPFGYLVNAAVYTCVYLVGLFGLAMMMFEERDLG